VLSFCPTVHRAAITARVRKAESYQRFTSDQVADFCEISFPRIACQMEIAGTQKIPTHYPPYHRQERYRSNVENNVTLVR